MKTPTTYEEAKAIYFQEDMSPWMTAQEAENEKRKRKYCEKFLQLKQTRRVAYWGDYQPGNLYYWAVEVWENPRVGKMLVKRGSNYQVVGCEKD